MSGSWSAHQRPQIRGRGPELASSFTHQAQKVFAELIFTEPCQPFALGREVDAVLFGCHRTTLSRTPLRVGARPSLERGGVCSTHPREVRLRRAWRGGNEVVSQCKMRRPQCRVDNRAPALPTVHGPAAAPFGSGSARLGLS